MTDKDSAASFQTMAICYDFDRTLTPVEMQAQGYIQELSANPEDFWRQVNLMAREHQMDSNLAYMYMMLKGATNRFRVTRDNLKTFGSRVVLYDGVESWFDRINAFALKHNICVEHYILSSGILEMIEGTSIAGKFKRIYANSFLYNDKGEAVWPAQNINYTNKTQFLFRISKGILDVSDDRVNDYMHHSKMRIPFRNMVYIGDSMTDVPCMKLLSTYEGYAVGVYDPQKQNKEQVTKLLTEQRIGYFAPADYTESSPLFSLLEAIILEIEARTALKARQAECAAVACTFSDNSSYS